MDPEILLSGIREMVSAGVRIQTTTDPDEKRIAGELYTTNESIVHNQLKLIAHHRHTLPTRLQRF